MISLDQLRVKLNEARRAQNKMEVSVLSMLIGELTANAKMVNGVKTITDLEVVAHLQKHLKKLHETIAIKRKATPAILAEDVEALFVAKFLPTMLTEDELVSIIKENGFANMGAFMSWLKTNKAGMYDGKLASDVFKKWESS